jgi:hypothetical protein
LKELLKEKNHKWRKGTLKTSVVRQFPREEEAGQGSHHDTPHRRQANRAKLCQHVTPNMKTSVPPQFLMQSCRARLPLTVPRQFLQYEWERMKFISNPGQKINTWRLAQKRETSWSSSPGFETQLLIMLNGTSSNKRRTSAKTGDIGQVMGWRNPKLSHAGLFAILDNHTQKLGFRSALV